MVVFSHLYASVVLLRIELVLLLLFLVWKFEVIYRMGWRLRVVYFYPRHN